MKSSQVAHMIRNIKYAHLYRRKAIYTMYCQYIV